MKKKYICRLSATNILVKVGGKVKRLEFESAVISEFGLRGSAYTTDNKEIQSAVENHPQFRNGQRDSITVYGESFTKPEPEPALLIVDEKTIPEGVTKDEIVDAFSKGSFPKDTGMRTTVIRKGKAKKKEA